MHTSGYNIIILFLMLYCKKKKKKKNDYAQSPLNEGDTSSVARIKKIERWVDLHMVKDDIIPAR